MSTHHTAAAVVCNTFPFGYSYTVPLVGVPEVNSVQIYVTGQSAVDQMNATKTNGHKSGAVKSDQAKSTVRPNASQGDPNFQELSSLVQRRMFELDFVKSHRLSDDSTGESWDAMTKCLVKSLKMDANPNQWLSIDRDWAKSKGLSESEVLTLSYCKCEKIPPIDLSILEPSRIRLTVKDGKRNAEILLSPNETVKAAMARMAKIYCALLDEC